MRSPRPRSAARPFSRSVSRSLSLPLALLAACSDAATAPGAASPAATPAASLDALSPLTTLVVAERTFQGGRGAPNHTDVVVVTPTGALVRRLTDHPADDTRPSMSPDRSKVAFTSSRDGGGLYVVNVDGTGLTRLAPATALDDVSWSADGARLVFAARPDAGSHRELFLVNADGTGLKRLTTDDRADEAPVLSADGTHVYFTRYTLPSGGIAGKPEVWRLTLATGQLEAFLQSAANAEYEDPTLSPNGKTLAFGERSKLWTPGPNGTGSFVTTARLVLVDLATRTRTVLFDASGNRVLSPSFSPDGASIAFEVAGFGIWRAPLATPGQAAAMTDAAYRAPSWTR